MAAQIRRLLGDDNEMSYAGGDHGLASWAGIGLARLIGLNGVNDLVADRVHPKNPHSTTPSVMTANTATTAMSATDLPCLRKGLKPISPVFSLRDRDASIPRGAAKFRV